MILAQVTLSGLEQMADGADKARTYLNEAIEANSQFLPAYSLLAQVDAMQGKLGDAVTKYEKLIELNPEALQYRTLLAMTHEQLGDFEKAATTYEEILNISPRFGIAANNLAWLIAENLNGNLDDALKYALLAKEELPKLSAVADTLGWIYHKKGSSRAALQLIEEAVDIESEAVSYTHLTLPTICSV